MNYTISELANAIDVKRQRVDKLLKEGRIPASIYWRGKKRFLRGTKELEAWIKSRKMPDKYPAPLSTRAIAQKEEFDRLAYKQEKLNQKALSAAAAAANHAKLFGVKLSQKDLPRPVLKEVVNLAGISTDSKNRLRSFSKHPSTVTAESLKSPATLGKALRASGAVSPSKRKKEKLHDEPTITDIFADLIMVWNKSLYSARKIEDDAEWSVDTRQKVNRHLRPIVDFYKSNERIISADLPDSQP